MIIATHWTLIIWVEIKTLQVLQQAKKAPDAWSQHETTQKNNQEKVINLNYFLFMLWWLVLWFLSCILFCTISTNFHTLSTGIFTRDQFASIKSCKPCQWSHDLCDRSGIFEHPKDSLHWMILLFSYIITSVFFPIVWNLHGYCKLVLKSVRLRPPLSKNFDHWVDVLISTSAPSHWLNSVALPVGSVLKFSWSLY